VKRAADLQWLGAQVQTKRLVDGIHDALRENVLGVYLHDRVVRRRERVEEHDLASGLDMTSGSQPTPSFQAGWSIRQSQRPGATSRSSAAMPRIVSNVCEKRVKQIADGSIDR
jgi:hypothetical protein